MDPIEPSAEDLIYMALNKAEDFLELPVTLTLNKNEAWNLLEIYQAEYRTSDGMSDKELELEQKLIDAVYGSQKEA